MHLHRSTRVGVEGRAKRRPTGKAPPARGPQRVARGARFVDAYLPALLAQASHLISSEFHVVARAAGVPVAEWRILATLTGGQAWPVGQLADTVIAPQPTVTRQLQRMEKKGVVERLADDSDRRLALVRITPAGEAMAADLVRLARLHEQRVLKPLGSERAALLKQVLRELIEGHGRLAGPAA
ncbi:MAG: winged helix-turn-helix transcriptional regulator [Rubrivivax sp.]|nr:winged helix-turn-helix transcriptional regulator [Rubrivivax sp.]